MPNAATAAAAAAAAALDPLPEPPPGAACGVEFAVETGELDEFDDVEGRSEANVVGRGGPEEDFPLPLLWACAAASKAFMELIGSFGSMPDVGIPAA